ncbi:Fpg/Nei family DNA glycosylase [Methanobacterium alcaliphilum]|uniref:Fpg/Nei family DNA glycosylase n=1 Tax=Methanobacterium alcaliphilum TaxID=392018 RepID=UPI00200A496D|nr:DNA-formamidopyrimidine glycosylase family protein [Methanobacterium alcaliphilum]MCK9151210.1 Fpg/Nei family DNA glycosylase [Methanobacterium alcaliphilum]
MPELPSLEIFKRYFDSTSLNQRIEEIKLNNPEILLDISSNELKNNLIGAEFISSMRYGKYLFANLKNSMNLILHFGMTGSLKYHSKTLDYSPHSRISILFEKGNVLDFEDPRKFGKIGMTSDINQFIAMKNLGPDALNIAINPFKKLFKNRKGNIKPLLMNQHFIAGIGNLYADEILYQSNIHPLTKAGDLTDDDLKIIYENMQMVLKKAIYFQDNTSKFPPEFLLAHRYPGGKCIEGEKLDILKVGGRTTYYCPKKQIKK